MRTARTLSTPRSTSCRPAAPDLEAEQARPLTGCPARSTRWRIPPGHPRLRLSRAVAAHVPRDSTRRASSSFATSPGVLRRLPPSLEPHGGHGQERVRATRRSRVPAAEGASAAWSSHQNLRRPRAPAVAGVPSVHRDPEVVRHDLPASGDGEHLPITTATSAAANVLGELGGVGTNIDDTLLTESVITVAGQQTLSRQSLERGTGVEDPQRPHAAPTRRWRREAGLRRDDMVMTNVARHVTYTDASPTGAELWPGRSMPSQPRGGPARPGRRHHPTSSTPRRWSLAPGERRHLVAVHRPARHPDPGGRRELRHRLWPGVRGVRAARHRSSLTPTSRPTWARAQRTDLRGQRSELRLGRTRRPRQASSGPSSLQWRPSASCVVYGRYAAYSFRFTNGQQSGRHRPHADVLIHPTSPAWAPIFTWAGPRPGKGSNTGDGSRRRRRNRRRP